MTRQNKLPSMKLSNSMGQNQYKSTAHTKSPACSKALPMEEVRRKQDAQDQHKAAFAQEAPCACRGLCHTHDTNMHVHSKEDGFCALMTSQDTLPSTKVLNRMHKTSPYPQIHRKPRVCSSCLVMLQASIPSTTDQPDHDFFFHVVIQRASTKPYVAVDVS